MPNQTAIELATNLISVHENCELFPYMDTTGHLTIGYGRNLTSDGISQIEAQYLRTDDINQCLSFAVSVSGWVNLSPPRQAVLLDMIFTLGDGGFEEFKNLIIAIGKQDYSGASAAMLDSDWARSPETGGRAKEDAQIMLSGAFPTSIHFKGLKNVQEIEYKDAVTGDIGVVRGNSFLSDLIAEGEVLAHEVTGNFVATHAFIFSCDNKIFEAVYPRISLREKDEYALLPTRVFRLNGISLEVKQQILWTLEREWLNKAYNVSGLIGMAGLEITRLLDIFGLRNFLSKKTATFCSELVAFYLKLLGFLLPGQPDTLDPEQIVNFLSTI